MLCPPLRFTLRTREEEADLTKESSAPRSLTVRPYEGASDAAWIAGLINASRADTGEEDSPVSAKAVQKFLEDSSVDSDPRTDVHLFFHGEQLVAYERTRRETWASGARVYHLGPHIHAEWRSKETVSEMIRHVCHYQSEIAKLDDVDVTPFLSLILPDPADETTRAALLDAAFEPCHAFLRMARRLEEDVALRDLPPAVEAHPIREKDYRKIYNFDRRIMRDSWGCEAPTKAHFAWWSEEAFLNPELWRVAWHEDEIVGTAAGIIGGTWTPGLGGEKGEIRFVRVAPEWRRRGIASALILRCMAALREQGIHELILGVDGANEEAATALYRKLGFEVTSRMTAYRYDLAT